MCKIQLLAWSNNAFTEATKLSSKFSKVTCFPSWKIICSFRRFLIFYCDRNSFFSSANVFLWSSGIRWLKAVFFIPQLFAVGVWLHRRIKTNLSVRLKNFEDEKTNCFFRYEIKKDDKKRGPAEKRAHLSNFSQFNSFLQGVSTLLNLLRKFLHDKIWMDLYNNCEIF